MTYTLDRPGAGLIAVDPAGEQLIFPLKHTEVQAQIAGNLGRVEVIQTFENPLTTTLEAVYTFPLPDEAAVDEMSIKIGDRTITGSIKQRQAAQQIYEQARQQGHTAGLLEQERDNIFTQSLANILPGEQIEVTIRYTESLKFAAGNYEFVFPMVVGPRYIPGMTIADEMVGGGTANAPLTRNQDTDLVPDASRLNGPILPSGLRSRHDINVTVEIMAGLPIGAIGSPSHPIHIDSSENQARVTLSGGDTIPNQDLILRYQVAGAQTQTTVLAQADDRGGHFAAYLIPAIAYRSDQLIPKDVVFLIDTSGSQSGDPLVKCQELMRRFIVGLNPHDTFSLIDFSNTTRQLSPGPLVNTPENQARALRYIDCLTANGGTDLQRGIDAVLNFPAPEPGRLRSIVLLTDGYIGNENQILDAVQRGLQPGNRLYSFGVGSSVNRFLLNRIAEIGRGIARIIRHDEPTEAVAEKFFQQINNPVLTNIQVRWEGAGIPPVIYPKLPPDLFAEQPLVLFGRKVDRIAGHLQITGTAAGGEHYQNTIELNFEPGGNPAITQLWGRARIKDLTNQMVSGDTKAGVAAVTQTALTYQLLSQYTAFVAVSDDVRVNAGLPSVSVQVPVEMPEGVSHRGIFGAMSASSSFMSASSSFMSAPSSFMSATHSLMKMRRVQADPSCAEATGGFGDMRARALPSSAQAAKVEEADDVLFSEASSEERTLLDYEVTMPHGAPAMAPTLSAIEPPVQGAAFLQPALPQPPQPISMSPASPVQIINVTGLDAAATAQLWQHLQIVELPTGFNGTIVFEFQLNPNRILGLSTGKGRVRQLVWDEAGSTVQDPTILEPLRRSLLTWQPPLTNVQTVRLVLQIQT
jgi:Ca-activated chloride channel homolog